MRACLNTQQECSTTHPACSTRGRHLTCYQHTSTPHTYPPMMMMRQQVNHFIYVPFCPLLTHPSFPPHRRPSPAVSISSAVCVCHVRFPVMLHSRTGVRDSHVLCKVCGEPMRGRERERAPQNGHRGHDVG